MTKFFITPILQLEKEGILQKEEGRGGIQIRLAGSLDLRHRKKFSHTYTGVMVYALRPVVT